ncbi:dihydrodipicolinate synthase family protein [Bradyrhizobium sp. 4]|uniref:dihydrodipicolinate synthase family protein n=1 Tax=unclassified Bradyrhizobium TaxID=2631580 RepID=UPI001FF960C7|nr:MULTISPECIES: dihydrodipicolinate synthase family protein [unclassified Bradyrhizobium]MCK1401581.1 dihydrodipicolinate synthase family protein [Bradyrhizobium sp. 39]MCK1750735.1 dihydrodipicolinate synthase family protein [Bradyrhizobium sp. 135]UPJ38022.1 dihydrodipicolinate synthase family protein [Bradyrhizobium sp. 4]
MSTSSLHPHGVFSAALTPLDAEFAPDHERFVAHCRHLLDEGCDGIALLGTTGEANSFSAAERIALLEAVVAAGITPQRLLPGTGVAALSETIALTRHALSVGVDTVVMLPPFYYKGVTDDGIFASYSEVVQRIGDARLKVVLYHIPQMSAQPISHALIKRLRAAYPSTFTGIKDSSGDFANMTAMVERFPGFSVLVGADPLLLPLLRKGGAGCITATSNLVARDLAYVYKHFRDSDDDAALKAAQARIVKARELVSRFPQMASLKALVAERTGHAGWQRLRPPLESLPPEQVKELLANATAIAA